MAVPKSKVSKARRDKRRSSHWKLEVRGGWVGVVEDPGRCVCPGLANNEGQATQCGASSDAVESRM